MLELSGAEIHDAKSNGAALAIVNREPTDIGGRADMVVHAESARYYEKY